MDGYTCLHYIAMKKLFNIPQIKNILTNTEVIEEWMKSTGFKDIFEKINSSIVTDYNNIIIEHSLLYLIKIKEFFIFIYFFPPV